MNTPAVAVNHVRKTFSHTSPDANRGTDDMWVDYLLGRLGRRSGNMAAIRRETIAVDDVSLSVDSGEFFGILGPNGAGKTTLIKMLATILRPNHGTITVGGYDTVRESAQARASLNVVAASGWFAFDMQLTLRQNLVFWGRLCGLPKPTAAERALLALTVVGLADWLDETPNHLSSGMRQRFALARGLLVPTPVFLLDEPTGNVDPVAGYQIRDFLRNDLNRELGQTIVLATHNMAEAEQLCDRVAIIDTGRVLACDRPSRLTRVLAGKVVAFDLPRAAPDLLRQLHASEMIRQLVDSPRDGGGVMVRSVLHLDAEPAALASLLPGDTALREISPTLEDALFHYTGKTLHEPSDHTPAD